MNSFTELRCGCLSSDSISVDLVKDGARFTASGAYNFNRISNSLALSNKSETGTAFIKTILVMSFKVT